MSVNRSRLAANLVADNNITSDIDNNRVGIGSTIPTATLNVAGIVSATSFYGDGSNLTGISGGSFAVGYASTDGDTLTTVGTAVTQVNFVGTGYTITVSGGIATVTNLRQTLKQLAFTSAGSTSYTAGSQISYTATTNDSNANFVIESNGGLSGLSINYTSGVMAGGDSASAGDYTIKLRSGTIFGTTDSFPLTVTVGAAVTIGDLNMNNWMGTNPTSFKVYNDDDADGVFNAISSGGVIANDGTNYVIDTNDSLISDATKHALYYDSDNSKLIGFRYSSSGTFEGVAEISSVTDTSDGATVGSGVNISNYASRRTAIGHTQNVLGGPNLGIGTAAGIGSTVSGYQPVGQYQLAGPGATKYLRIIPSDSTLDNFGTRIDDHDWSFGFTLEDPWLMGGFHQLLVPEDPGNGWVNSGYRLWAIGDSIYAGTMYGGANSLNSSSSGEQSSVFRAYIDSNRIAPAGSTIAVHFDKSDNDVDLYINGQLAWTGTSAYVYMKSSGSTSQPVLSFGDAGPSYDGIPNDDDEPMGWPFRIRDLWIANNGNIDATAITSGISTFRNRDLASYSGYSNIDVYLTFADGGITITKGNVSIGQSDINFALP